VLNCHFSRDPVWTWPAPVLGIVLTGLSHALSAQPCCPAALLPWSCRVSSVLHLVDSRPPLERAAYFVMCSASQTGNLQRIATSSTGNSLAWGLACFYSSTVLQYNSTGLSVLDFQFPISNLFLFPDRSTVQTMPDQTTLAAPPVPQARTPNRRLRASGAPIRTLRTPAGLPVHALPF